MLGPLSINIEKNDYGVFPVSDRRLQTFNLSYSNATFPAATTTTLVSLSGAGRGLFVRCYSLGITPNDSILKHTIDGTTYDAWKIGYSPRFASVWGISATGIYQLGRDVLYVRDWDTVNDEYNVWGTISIAIFASTYAIAYQNNDAVNSASVIVEAIYSLYTSTQRIKLKPKARQRQYVQELRKLVKRDYKGCDAVIFDHYIVNPNAPLNQQISKPRLQIVVPNQVYDKHRDKIVDRLIKEGVVEDILK